MRKITRQQAAKRIEEILARMSREATPFELGESSRRQRLAKCENDLLAFAETYLPHYVTCPFAPMHREWKSLANEPGDHALASFRESAKSVLLTLANPLRKALFGHRRFVIVISDTEDQAKDLLGFIRIELEENPRIAQDFGAQRRPGAWEDNDFTTKKGTRFLAKGKRQKVRGLRNRQFRPDMIVIDDLEDDQTVLNQKLTDRAFEWIQGPVKGALAQDHELWLLGQRLTSKCVLAQALEHPGFSHHSYSAQDEDGHSAWPAKFSDRDLAEKKKSMGTAVYSREYLNLPMPVGEHHFRQEWIKRYHPDWLLSLGRIPVYGWLDPSARKNEAADYKAIVYVGRTPEGLFPVVRAWIRHASFDTLARQVYEDFKLLRPMRLGCESNGFQALLAPFFDTYAKDYGFSVPMVLPPPQAESKFRISRLSPYVERAKILFPEGSDPDVALLIEQLLFFPDTGVKDDGPDALEGAVGLAEEDAFSCAYQSSGKRRASFSPEGYF